eukprot:4077770-Lingulodinium_polyedra.AAC.1
MQTRPLRAKDAPVSEQKAEMWCNIEERSVVASIKNRYSLGSSVAPRAGRESPTPRATDKTNEITKRA